MPILYDVPADDYYRRDRRVGNFSGLKLIAEQSLAHYAHYCDGHDAETEGKRFGKAWHVALLEPERFGDCYRVLPADRPKDLRYLRNAGKPSQATLDAIAWWDEWDAAESTAITVEASEFELARAMATSLRALVLEFPGAPPLTVGELFDMSQKEVTIRWEEEVEVDGQTVVVPMKGRADVYNPEFAFAFDPKSCLSASPSRFSAAVTSYYYHLQHVVYTRGFAACGAPLRAFGFLPTEKTAPYIAASYYVDAVSEERGQAVFASSLRKLARAILTDQWPGYTTTLTPIGIKAWGHYDADEVTA